MASCATDPPSALAIGSASAPSQCDPRQHAILSQARLGSASRVPAGTPRCICQLARPPAGSRSSCRSRDRGTAADTPPPCGAGCSRLYCGCSTAGGVKPYWRAIASALRMSAALHPTCPSKGLPCLMTMSSARTVSSIGVLGSGRWQTRSTYSHLQPTERVVYAFNDVLMREPVSLGPRPPEDLRREDQALAPPALAL